MTVTSGTQRRIVEIPLFLLASSAILSIVRSIKTVSVGRARHGRGPVGLPLHHRPPRHAKPSHS